MQASDLIDAYLEGKRVRGSNLRASVLTNIATITPQNNAFILNEPYLLCLLPTSAVINSVVMKTRDNWDSISGTIDIYGVNQSFTNVNDAFSSGAILSVKSSFSLFFDEGSTFFPLYGKNIYEACCDSNNQPTPAFQPYISNKQVALGITLTEQPAKVSDILFSVEYTDTNNTSSPRSIVVD